jgi:DNA-binding LytR/AlgR family response regulator
MNPTTINCIIIDDDAAATAYLKGYIARVSFLNLLGTFQEPAEGMAALDELPVQLIFMDIGKPGINGMELAKILNSRQDTPVPRIIFISGFERFAVQSYQVNALDYLLKPISYEDFFRAAYKAKCFFEPGKDLAANTNTYGPTDFVFLKVEHDMTRVYLKDILYVESFKDYVKVYTINKVYKALATMKCTEEKLPRGSFMRVHRSFIVSLDKIETVHNHTVRIGKTIIPVTEQYRPPFREFMQRWF